MKKLILLFIAFVDASFSLVNAQSIPSIENATSTGRFFNSWSISSSVGLMLFNGDVKQYQVMPIGKNTKNSINEINTGLNLCVNKRITPLFGVQGEMLFGKLSGFIRENKEYFVANTMSYTLNANINISNLIFEKRETRKPYFYGSIGIGLIDFRSVRRELNADSPDYLDQVYRDFGYKNDDGKTKDKKTTEIIVPVKFGYAYPLNSFIDGMIETSFRFVNTDKLDAKIIHDNMDKYNFTSLGVVIHL